MTTASSTAPPARPGPDNTTALKRLRWGVRAALLLGVATSVAANILHANPDPISKAIAAWPPVALLVTVELLSRIPVHRPILAAIRLIATTAIAGIAAWVSYWHMAAVAARYGEVGASPYLLPVSVDGLVVVASVSLVELSGRLRAAQTPHDPPTAPCTRSDLSTAQPSPALDPAPTGNQPVASHDPPREEPDQANQRDPQDTSRTGNRRQRPGRVNATEQAVTSAYLSDPTQHPAVIAKLVGTSERSVRRYINKLESSR